jgi:hypothetical protein
VFFEWKYHTRAVFLFYFQENDCPKRMMKCGYCDIDIPRDELDEHHEYCGTRTEQCFKCQKYIMIKDQQRHEDSDCTYPEQRPSPPQNGATSRPGPPAHLNSFVLNELTRMADIPRIQNDFDQLSVDSDDVEPVESRRPIATRHPARSNKPNIDKNTSAVKKNTGNVSKNTNAASTNRKKEVSKNVGSSSSVQQKNQPPMNSGSGPTTKKSSNTSTSGQSASTRTGMTISLT